MKINTIERVSFFFTLLLAEIELNCANGEKEINEDDTVITFSGNGSSDALTIKNLKDFLKELEEVKEVIGKYERLMEMALGSERKK